MTQATAESREAVVQSVWEAYWRERGASVPAWDVLSALILERILKEAGDVAGKVVCEAGCGSGRISKRLLEAGARVVCLDIADEALALSKSIIGESDGAEFVRASILEMPKRGAYDIIWNAGVIEHFLPAEQERILDQFRMALKPGGRAILLTPFSRSLPYRAAKWWMERNRSWPYGPETPVSTLRPLLPPGLLLKEEYTVAFLPFFLDADKIARRLQPACASLRAFAARFDPKTLRRIDRLFSAILGGYLLVSILQRPGPRRLPPQAP